MMKKITLFAWVTMFLAVACSDEKQTVPPTLAFGTESIYVHNNDTVGEGKQLKFHIIAEGFDAKVTNIVAVLKSGDSIKTMADFGVWKDKLDTVLVFYKGGLSEEEWQLTIMDQNRNFASASLRVVKDPVSSFGEIVSYDKITLGYQGNSGAHFFDTETGETFTSSSGAANQAVIDVVVYYYLDSGKPSPTFSSPGDQDAATWYPEIKQWNTLNYTKYDYVSKVGVDAFDAAQNDSLLIKAYDDVWGRRKYKYCLAGTVFPFKTINGKIGLVKILRSDLNETGTIDFAIKVQK